MEKKDKRKKILKVSGLIGLFLIVFGLSYALFTVTLNGTKKVKIKTGKLELQLLDSNNNPIYITDQNNTTSYEINLDNQVPVSDEVGLDSTAFEFKLKNSGSVKASYTIYLDDVALESGEERIDDEYIRYSLTKNGSEENPQALSSRELDKGTIEATNTTNEYTLKIWIAEDADNAAMDKVFNATLRVEGTQYVAPESSYGTKIAEGQITSTITATYYQPEDTGYNSRNKVKRMSNVKKIDNEETYEGGTLVISGTGAIPTREDYEEDINRVSLELFLAGKDLGEVTLDSYGYPIWSDDFVYKYNPSTLVIGDGIESIGAYAFAFIESLNNVKFPKTLSVIGESAFCELPLTNVEFEEGLKTIERYAFDHTLLTSVVLPSSLEMLEDGAFYGTNVEEFVLPPKVKILSESVLGSCYSLRRISLNNVEEIESNALSDAAIEELYLSKNIKSIESGAFGGYYGKTKRIYCETQAVADMIESSNAITYGPEMEKVNIIVDPTKFE